MDEFKKKEQVKQENYLRQRSNSVTERQQMKGFDLQDINVVHRNKSINEEIKDKLPEAYLQEEKVAPANDNGLDLPERQQIVPKREHLFMPKDFSSKIDNYFKPQEEKIRDLANQTGACDELLKHLKMTQNNHTSEEDKEAWAETYRDTLKEAKDIRAELEAEVKDFTAKKEALYKVFDKEAEISQLLIELVDENKSIKTEEDEQKLKAYFDKMSQVEDYIQSFKAACPIQLQDESNKIIREYNAVLNDLEDTKKTIVSKLFVPSTLIAEGLEDMALNAIKDQAKNVFDLGKDMPAKLVKLIALQHKVLTSESAEEKKNFLNEVKQVEDYMYSLYISCPSDTQDSDAYKKTIEAFDTQLNSLAKTVAKVTFDLIDFDMMKAKYQEEISQLEIKKEKAEAERLDQENESVAFLKSSVQLNRCYVELMDLKLDGYIFGSSKEKLEHYIDSLPLEMKDNINAFKRRLKGMSLNEVKKLQRETEELVLNLQDAIDQHTKALDNINTSIHFKKETIKNIDHFRNILTVTYDLERENDSILFSSEVERRCAYLEKVALLGGFKQFSFVSENPEISLYSDYIKLSRRYISLCQNKAKKNVSKINIALTRQFMGPVEIPTINIARAVDRVRDIDNPKKMVATIMKYRLYNGEEEPQKQELKEVYTVIEQFMAVEHYQLEELFGIDAAVKYLKEIHKERVKASQELVALYNRLDADYGHKLGKEAIAYLACRSKVYARLQVANRLIDSQASWGQNKKFEKVYNKFTIGKYMQDNAKIIDQAAEITSDEDTLCKNALLGYGEGDEVFLVYKEANQRALQTAFND